MSRCWTGPPEWHDRKGAGLSGTDELIQPSTQPNLMNNKLNRMLVACLAVGVATLILGQSVLAQNSVVPDAAGDASPSKGYLDILTSKIEARESGVLVFTMELGGEVPTTPSENFIGYNWFLDTAPEVYPPENFAYEFIVVVRWASGKFDGLLVDRRPNLQGQPCKFTLIPSQVVGSRVVATVNLTQIDNPARFEWNSVTRLAPYPDPSISDYAPNTGHAIWAALTFPVFSDFATGNDGWIIAQNGQPAAWSDSGGSPGGYVLFLSTEWHK